MRRIFALLVMLIGLFPAGVATADDAALGRRGETVYPISNHQVRMVAEEVHLAVRPRETLVDVTFTFENQGPAHDVLMGFPVGRPGDVQRGDFELHEFRTWVDGREVSAVREKGARPVETPAGEDHRNLSYPEWFTWTVRFGPGETHTVRNTYRAVNYHTSNGFAGTGYILRTGQVWRGSIGSAVVTVELDGILPSELTGVSPASYRWQGERMVWRFQEFEPSRDVQLIFRTRRELNDPEMERWGALYTAVREGRRTPDELLEERNLPLGLKRYLMDRAGFEGSAPLAPQVSVGGAVTLSDSDGDLDDWGLAVYTSPDASLNPLSTAGGFEHYWEDQVERQVYVDTAPWQNWSEVWYQAWAVDGRGHRTETGWVKLVIRESAPQPPAKPEPKPSAPEPQPPRPAAGDVVRHDLAPWVLLGLMLAVSAWYVIVRREK